jgi:hypothetical protein
MVKSAICFAAELIVLAAGDWVLAQEVSHPSQRAMQAVGEGSAAIYPIHKYLETV